MIGVTGSFGLQCEENGGLSAGYKMVKQLCIFFTEKAPWLRYC